MPTATPERPIRVGLTDRGRVRAVPLSLAARWATLTGAQQARARVLVDRLAAAIRREVTPPDPAA